MKLRYSADTPDTASILTAASCVAVQWGLKGAQDKGSCYWLAAAQGRHAQCSLLHDSDAVCVYL